MDSKKLLTLLLERNEFSSKIPAIALKFGDCKSKIETKGPIFEPDISGITPD